MNKEIKNLLWIDFAILITISLNCRQISAASHLLPFKNQAGQTITHFDLTSHGITADDSLGAAFYKLGTTPNGTIKVNNQDYLLKAADNKSVNPINGGGQWLYGTKTPNWVSVNDFMNNNTKKIAAGEIYLEGKAMPRAVNGEAIPISYVDHYNADGSIDFESSGWQPITTLIGNVNWLFERNGRKYNITASGNGDGNHPLSAFLVKDLTDNVGYTYVYNNLGSGTTSFFDLVEPQESNIVKELDGVYNAIKMYYKPSPYASYNHGYAIATSITSFRSKHFATTEPVETYPATISEIVDVNDSGVLQHYLTYTEKNAPKTNFEVGTMRDTDLSIFKDATLDNEHRYPNYLSSSYPEGPTSPGDRVDIIKGPENSVYVTATTSKKPNIILNGKIHYIDVTGKTEPASGWQPTSGPEASQSPEVISVQKSDLVDSYDLTWLKKHPEYRLVALDSQSSADVNPNATKFKFPQDLIDQAIKTDFRVYFAGPNQYVVDFDSNGTKRYSYDKWINAASFTENQPITTNELSRIDSATASMVRIPSLNLNESYTFSFTEEVVSSGELALDNTRDYYVYVSSIKRTVLRSVPNFDFGKNIANRSNSYPLANSVASPTQTYLNLDYTQDNSGSISGMPIERYLDLGEQQRSRALVVTDYQAIDNDNWQVEAALSNFQDSNGKVISPSSQFSLNLNPSKIKVQGINDDASGVNATYTKSVEPLLAAHPVVVANATAVPILLGKNGTRSAVGSWLVNFGDKDSVELNFPLTSIQNTNEASRELQATLTWTLLATTP